MSKDFTLAVTGDAILTRRVSNVTDERFLNLVKILRETDVSYTHLETLIHDYKGPEVYPAAEAGGAWQRAPKFCAEELKWMGFDIVSTAHNHSLDYSYGGMFQTWEACDKAGLSHAGTGMNLGEARAPAYFDGDGARAALISTTGSFTGWARAGEVSRDVIGRPGLNPLRYYYKVDTETWNQVTDLGVKLGMWMSKMDDEMHLSPPGCHNTNHIFVHDPSVEGVTTVALEEDVQGNLASVRDAKRQADYVIVHVHAHEWNHRSDLSESADFLRPFAHRCIDDGADVFVAEGSHAPFRGIEIYNGKPIFHDPGDFILMSRNIARLPSDFFWRIPEVKDRWQATTADGMDALDSYPPKPPFNPPGGFFAQKVIGATIPVCTFDSEGALKEIKLHPCSLIKAPRSQRGLPLQADPETGKKIIEFIAELSEPYGTKIEYEDGVGIIRL